MSEGRPVPTSNEAVPAAFYDALAAEFFAQAAAKKKVSHPVTTILMPKTKTLLYQEPKSDAQPVAAAAPSESTTQTFASTSSAPGTAPTAAPTTDSENRTVVGPASAAATAPAAAPTANESDQKTISLISPTSAAAAAAADTADTAAPMHTTSPKPAEASQTGKLGDCFSH